MSERVHARRRARTKPVAIVALVAGALLAGPPTARAGERAVVVTASAYNSVPQQTSGDPWTGAWGDRLEHGMRALAVSRDLLALGVERGTVVEVEGLGPGLDGKYVVLDKMARRWRHKIDLYMGRDVPAARRFGRRKATITFHVPPTRAAQAATAVANAEAAQPLAESEAGQ